MRIARSLLPAAILALLICPPARAQATYEQLQAFSGLLNQIRLNYVDSVSYNSLVHAAIDGVLHSLDPHSYFISREDLERRTQFEAGSLPGAGLNLDEVDGMPVVVAVAPGSPAARAGIQPGDRLTAVNDTAVAGLAVETLQTRMIGEKGARATFRLERGPRLAPQGFTVNLKYDFIPAKSVMMSTMLDSQTGYLRLLQFYFESGKEVETALKKLEDHGMRRLVLDLRANPGGVMAAAAEVAGLFLDKDVLVWRQVGRTPSAAQDYRTGKAGRFATLPLIIMVNEHSASAAEMLSGSFQDLDRALIVGRRTFGKGLVQRAIMVPPRSDAVYLTIARVLTPSGRAIQRSYRGLTTEQYMTMAGTPAKQRDSTWTFHTAAGRPVEGGGGVAPDIELSTATPMPVWWTEAANDWLESMVDSVANTLDVQSFAQWKTSPQEWRTRLAVPFLARVRDRMGVDPRPDSLTTDRIAWVTAYRATEVRWGTERAYDFALANDREIRMAVASFDKLPELLKKP